MDYIHTEIEVKANTGTKPLVAVVPFPKTLDEMLSKRVVGGERKLVDIVEDLMLKHLKDETFAALLVATDNSESQTGKVSLDNAFAAKRLMELGGKDSAIGKCKVVVVQRALNAALRRYKMTPAQRRVTLSSPQASDAV